MSKWRRLAGSLYARRDGDTVSLREWDSPRAPVWSGTVPRILAAIEGAADNVTFPNGRSQGAVDAVTVQAADLADLINFLEST